MRNKVRVTEKPKSEEDEIPAKEDVILPEPEISLDAVYAQYATSETEKESDADQIARAEIAAAAILAEPEDECPE
jgi:hypothetical protein